MSHALRNECRTCHVTTPPECPECGPGVNHGTWHTDCLGAPLCPKADDGD